MADNTNRPDDAVVEGATPPGRGEQNQDTLRAGRMRPISGPGASDFLAATGTQELPGVDPSRRRSAARDESPLTDPAALVPRIGPDHEPIPGERDPQNLTASQPGGMGAHGADAHTPPNRDSGMDDDTTEERRREGGGAPRERRHPE